MTAGSILLDSDLLGQVLELEIDILSSLFSDPSSYNRHVGSTLLTILNNRLRVY
jgi:hypothetical protein